MSHYTFFAQRLVFLSIEWNSIRLGGPANGIVTKNCTQNSARWWGVVGMGGVGGGVGGPGVEVVGYGSRGWWGLFW